MKQTRAKTRVSKPPREKDIQWSNRCYGYVRSSSREQSNPRYSTENQKLRIGAWSTIFDHEVVKIFQDDKTSDNPNQNLLQLLESIKEGETLVVLTISLLCSNIRDLLNLVHALDVRGCRLISIDENIDNRTPTGRFMITTLGAFMQLQEDMASEDIQKIDLTQESLSDHVLGDKAY